MPEDSYTLKEMVQELRVTARDQVLHVATISSTLENIDKHLAQLNSKVASHERDIGLLQNFQIKAGVYISIAVFFAVTIVNKVLANISL